jgi:hypothetical protein
MRIKDRILAEVANGQILVDDLVATMGLKRTQVVENARHMQKEDLIQMVKDDITGLPAYLITDKGRYEAGKLACKVAKASTQEQTDQAEAVAATEDVMSLLGIISDIRAAIGDTGQIMLGDLAGAIKAIVQQRDELINIGREVDVQIEDIIRDRDMLRANLEAAQRDLMKGATLASSQRMKEPIAWGHAWECGFTRFEKHEDARADIERSFKDGSIEKSYLVAIMAVASMELTWKEAA